MITVRISSPDEYRAKFSFADPEDNQWRWYIEEVIPSVGGGAETITLAGGTADTESQANLDALEMHGRMQEQGRI